MDDDRGPRRGFDDDRPPRRGGDDDRGPRRGFDDDRGPRRGFDDDRGPRRGFDDDRGPRRGFDDDRGPRRGMDDSRGSRRGADDDWGPRRGGDDDRGGRRGMDDGPRRGDDDAKPWKPLGRPGKSVAIQLLMKQWSFTDRMMMSVCLLQAAGVNVRRPGRRAGDLPAAAARTTKTAKKRKDQATVSETVVHPGAPERRSTLTASPALVTLWLMGGCVFTERREAAGGEQVETREAAGETPGKRTTAKIAAIVRTAVVTAAIEITGMTVNREAHPETKKMVRRADLEMTWRYKVLIKS